MVFGSAVVRALVAIIAIGFAPSAIAAHVGYYRQPALAGDRIVFVSEGDLWIVSIDGGAARRLTTHAGDERYPAISPDGTRVAYLAEYEGPTEVYTMPLDGGRPVRRSYGLAPRHLSGWRDDDSLLVATQSFSKLPSDQLVVVTAADDRAGVIERVPLAQAADGVYGGRELFFTRLAFQGSHTKRYKGGTAQNLWCWRGSGREAEPLTADYPGTSKRPMWWDGRVWFATDRDGAMNLWSMTSDGSDLQQHTEHVGFDLKDPSLRDGRIVYQLGADIWLYDIASGMSQSVLIELNGDLDQTRENWVDDPKDYVTAQHVSPDGDRVALTARGQVFVAPKGQGRLVHAGRRDGVRYRDARFMPDGRSIVALSDSSGEVELWQLPANGVGEERQLTTDGDVLRWGTVPSPDGKWIAHWDKHQRLFVLNTASGENLEIAENPVGDYAEPVWSPDSKYLAFVEPGPNMMSRVHLWNVDSKEVTPITSDRYDSRSPAWHPKGKWLYFLSDRNLRSVVPSPWGSYQPEPFLDRKTFLYELALQPGQRSPFLPDNELSSAAEKAEDKKKDAGKGEDGKGKDEQTVDIAFDGLAGRLQRVPVGAGNYSNLTVNADALFWIESPTEGPNKLWALKRANDDPKPVEVVTRIGGYEMSGDQKKLLIGKGNDLYVIDAKPAKAGLDDARVDLSGWMLSVEPRQEWRQMFDEAWRLERDYFYAKNMHGVDWPAMREKYAPLVDRVASRAELSDLVAQLVSELSALHIFVRGGDLRDGDDDVSVASLGGRFTRDDKAGGYRIEELYRSDPDEPDARGPLTQLTLDVEVGDVITKVNGVPTLDAADLGELLRHTAGQQVLLTLKRDRDEERDVIVEPVGRSADGQLRYREWELTRRERVEERGDGRVGYVHLRAMGNRNFSEWARDFYPVFEREGLVIDVRHNRGGNIDSWILGRLLRRAWFYWNQHHGRAPLWNMQYAFRGHVAVLINERTASDGEAFAEGIKQLDIGEVFGTRTWGGEVWLSSSNFLADGGIATSAEFGVFGPQGDWLIEGWGVEPDRVVDNLPHATFNGEDAQLDAAIDYLMKKMRDEPVVLPDIPAFPDKSSEDNR